MPQLSANGAELSYQEFGSGPTLVVSAQQEFAPGGFVERLAAPPTGYHVVAITLRRLRKADEGPDEERNPRWYARWSDDVFAATQALGLSDFIYTGVSHGAVIGWHLAVEHPGLLRALVAIVGVPPSRERRAAPPSGRASQMEARQDPAILRPSVERLFGPTRDPTRLARRQTLVDERIKRILATPADEAAVRLGIGFPDVETDAELSRLLQTVRIPALIIGGMHDPWVTPEGLLTTARAVGGSKVVIFSDESHLLATESPRKVLGEFKLFVDDLDSRAPGAHDTPQEPTRR
jgi:pimeloyl-ACP methyl ester carboxylesterase